MKSFAFLPFLLVLSCADRPVVYTGVQFGAHVQGIKENVPQKVSVGYDRTEIGWLPNGRESTVKGYFDGEFHPLKGVAIRDELATGDAALAAASDTGDPGNGDTQNSSEWAGQSMLVSTTSKMNLGINASSADGASPSFNFGFKRSVFALFPRSSGDLPPTRAALSIHTSGLGGKVGSPNGLTKEQHLQSNNGVRVTQVIATGNAAKAVPKEPVQPATTPTVAEAKPDAPADTPSVVKSMIQKEIKVLEIEELKNE